MSESPCHPDCTIGPNADHPGSSSYRCQDKNGQSLPFPGERCDAIDLGDGYFIYVFDPESYWCNYCGGMAEHTSSGHPEPKTWNVQHDELWTIAHDDPGRPVHPNTAALNVMAAKVARIRDLVAEWHDDDSEHGAAWSLAADIIEAILDDDEMLPSAE